MKPKLDIGDQIGETDAATQLELFDADEVTGVLGIRVFDVGQGDCIGVIGPDEQVFCYIDYGGLADFPDVDNAQDRIPVVHAGKRVSIVLTHWDKDHYWSAKKRNTDAQRCQWLVPRQMVSPQASLLAAELHDAQCWPEAKGKDVESFDIGDQWTVEIRKCNAFSNTKKNEDRNRTGLVITIQQWSSDRITQFMLLPGDCPFHNIPNLPDAPICRLVAYHHGAKKHWTRKTRDVIEQSIDARGMAYSYGDNEYGHPYRRNYRPLWDSTATTTAEARERGEGSIDLRW
jgi:hypothetical protein